MVVKPLANLARTRKGLAQPGVKVRGREYLRIIYGPGLHRADQPRAAAGAQPRPQAVDGAARVRARAGVARRAAREPLWRVHEPVFAVLALESEPVDPRL